MSDTNFSLVLVSVYDTFHLHLTALCIPLPFGLQLSVLSSPLLLESPLRLFLDVVTTVCLCFGLIYFNLLGSNNISRPEVRKARERVNRKLLDVATGKLRIVMLKENKGFFLFLASCQDIACFFVCTHTQVGKVSRCVTCSMKVYCMRADTNSPCHTLTQIYMRRTTLYGLPEFNSSWAEKQLHKLEKTYWRLTCNKLYQHSPPSRCH